MTGVDGEPLREVAQATDDHGPPPAPMSRRERNKDEKRRRIISAGRHLFQSRGFDQTSTAAIASRAGVGSGTFYLYATSKEDLLVAVFKEDVSRIWHDAFALVDPDRSLVDQLLGLFGHVALFHEQDPSLSRAFFKELLFVSPPLRDDVTDFIATVYGRLRSILERAQATGRLDADVPVTTLARNLYSLWYPVMQSRYADSITFEHAQARVERAVRLSLRGIASDR